jgi:hypothetical protein
MGPVLAGQPVVPVAEDNAIICKYVRIALEATEIPRVIHPFQR